MQYRTNACLCHILYILSKEAIKQQQQFVNFTSPTEVQFPWGFSKAKKVKNVCSASIRIFRGVDREGGSKKKSFLRERYTVMGILWNYTFQRKHGPRWLLQNANAILGADHA